MQKLTTKALPGGFKNTDLQRFDNSSIAKACLLQKINIFDENGN